MLPLGPSLFTAVLVRAGQLCVRGFVGGGYMVAPELKEAPRGTLDAGTSELSLYLCNFSVKRIIPGQSLF